MSEIQHASIEVHRAVITLQSRAEIKTFKNESSPNQILPRTPSLKVKIDDHDLICESSCQRRTKTKKKKSHLTKMRGISRLYNEIAKILKGVLSHYSYTHAHTHEYTLIGTHIHVLTCAHAYTRYTRTRGILIRRHVVLLLCLRHVSCHINM